MSEADTTPSRAEGLVGTVLSGRYKIVRLLGEGGMGAVYLGEHQLMHKRIAIKVLHPDMTEDPEVVARFQREAMAASHIEHPNIAVATDFGKTPDGSFFLVLEYLEGRSLHDELKAQGRLAQEIVCHVAQQIAAALGRAHERGIVHRDLKPDNVMLVERDGDPWFVKVLDFGIAKVPVDQLVGQTVQSPQGLTRIGVLYGTPGYMAPEQALGQEVDARADLFALGVTLYEMLCGARPFAGESSLNLVTALLVDPVPPLSPRVPGLWPELGALVGRLLEKSPARRPASAREVYDEITGIVQSRASAATSAAPASVSINAPAASSVAPPAATPTPAPVASTRPSAPAPAKSGVGPLVAMMALVAATGLLAVIALVVIVSRASARDSSSPGDATTQPAPVTASESELAEARQRGPDALEALARKVPTDRAVAKALVLAYHEQKRLAEAMTALSRLAQLDPTAGADDGVRAAAKAAADASGDAQDRAFSLLEGPLGQPGADCLYELSTGAGVKEKTQERAGKSLAKPGVKDNLSPALRVLVGLKSASSCEGKKKVLRLAAEAGDRRALKPLQALTQKRGCGFAGLQDCWSCMRGDNELTDAIKAIEARPQ